jgi:triosephosphate isomerase
MNLGPKETEKFFADLSQLSDLKLKKTSSGVPSNPLKICLFPPLVSIPAALLAKNTLGFPIEIGAQNIHWDLHGAFTGEVSGPMLKEWGIHSALVGHSERRQHFGETDGTVLQRTQSLLKQGFQVITCLGETLDDRTHHQTSIVLTAQFSKGIPDSAHVEIQSQKLILAYEPVWAIGTGVTPTLEEIETAHQLLRNLIAQRWSPEVARHALILYGGSVTPDNIEKILSCPNVDGALVGGASTQPQKFLALLELGREMSSQLPLRTSG